MACIRYSYTSLETVKPSGLARDFLESIHVNTNAQNNDFAEEFQAVVVGRLYFGISSVQNGGKEKETHVTTLDILMKNCFSSNSKHPLIITLKRWQHRTVSQPQLLY